MVSQTHWNAFLAAFIALAWEPQIPIPRTPSRVLGVQPLPLFSRFFIDEEYLQFCPMLLLFSEMNRSRDFIFSSWVLFCCTTTISNLTFICSILLFAPSPLLFPLPFSTACSQFVLLALYFVVPSLASSSKYPSSKQISLSTTGIILAATSAVPIWKVSVWMKRLPMIQKWHPLLSSFDIWVLFSSWFLAC